MNKETQSMENSTEVAKNGGGISKNIKHTSRYVATRIMAVGSMILSSCGIKNSTNSSIEIDQNTPPQTNSENLPNDTQESSSPAIVPTEEGQPVNIESSNYPTNTDNFIIDSRSNEEKMNLIKSWAPDDVEKEISLYNAEFKRIGINPNDIEYKASIVDGKSWALYPENKKTNTSYIVSIDNIIRPSIDLFGYLNKKESDDFFDLVPVNIKNAEVIGDKSGWHIFAQIKNGQVTQWYDASKDKINSIEIEPAPTPEPSYIINNDLPALPFFEMMDQVEKVAKKFSSISFEDFTSGRLLAFEQKYVAENPIFNEEVQSKPLLKSKNAQTDGPGWGSFRCDFVNPESSGVNRDNINTRPIRILSYYVLNDDDLLKSIGFDLSIDYQGKSPFWLMTWAVHNDDGTTTLGHSLIDIFDHSSTLEMIKTFKKPYSLPEDDLILPTPVYKYYDLKIKEGFLTRLSTLTPYLIYQIHPELQPDEELIEFWMDNRQMPKELEGKIFGWYNYPNTW